MLCEVCRDIFANPGARGQVSILFNAFYKRYTHHSPPAHLKAYADSGCYICQRIWKQLLPDEQQLVLSMSTVRYTISQLPSIILRFFSGRSIGRNGWTIFNILFPDVIDFNGAYGWHFDSDSGMLNFIFGASDKGWKTVAFDVLAADELPELSSSILRCRPDQHGNEKASLREMILNVSLATTTDSAETWSFIRKHWHARQERRSISTDMNELPNASATSSDIHPAYRPNRLIDIGGNLARLSLAPGKLAQAEQPYATLSYRWEAEPPASKHDPSQLTQERLTQWMNGIAESLLPRTYRDAIYVARQLEIRYIWIDAMCILKDQEQDFQQEAAQMSDIYKGAALNIAGDGDRHSGLFRHRLHAHLTPELVDCKWTDFGYYYPRSIQHDVAMEGEFYVLESEYRKGILLQAACNTRGWVVQERLLSDCTLHFGFEQVFWESYDARCCELFPFGYPSSYTSSVVATEDLNPYLNMLEQVRTSLWLGLTPDEEIVERQQSGSWRAIVELYSRTDVTIKRDRMIAFSGLARHWQKLAPEMTKYVAGMWYHESQVPGCFLWRVKDGRTADGQTSTTQPETSAPSWSWLSVSGTVLAASDAYRHPSSHVVRSVEVRLQDPANLFGLVIPDQSVLEITGTVLRPRPLFWPLSTTNLSGAASDRSQITATGILTDYVTCSIDDMTAFQKRFEASRPLPHKLLRRLCLALIRFSPIWVPILALALSLRDERYGWPVRVASAVLYAVSAYVGIVSVRPFFPTFWYREREEVCFLSVAQGYGRVDGLVLQLVQGDERIVYRRLGIFTGALDRHFDTKKKRGPVQETVRII